MGKNVDAFVGVSNHFRLKRYKQLCFAFLTYLRDKEHIRIFFDGYDRKAEDYTFMIKPYMHRWKPEYTRYRLAQFYALEDWAKENPLPLTMLTFTTYHDNPHNKKRLNIDESWVHLKWGFHKASQILNKTKKVPYIWVVEPQPKSGYPHIHAGYFAEFNEEEQDRLKNHWSKILGIGDYKHGLNFSIDQEYQPGDVTSLRNYFMKYLSKTFINTIDEWTPEQLVFNSVAWKNGYRFFGCSRDISAAMHIKNDEKKESIEWFTTRLQGYGLSGEPLDMLLHRSPVLIL